jgi:hypothetical protein
VLGRNKNRESKALPGRASVSPDPKPSRPSAFNSLSSRFGRNNHDLPTPLEESEELPIDRQTSPLRTMSSAYRSTPNGDKELPPIDGSAQSLAAAGLAPEPSRRQNSISQLQQPLQPSLQPSPRPVSSDFTQPLQPTQPTQSMPSPQRDNDGFSEPPRALDAISQAEQDAADANEASQSQFKLDIRSAPIAEEGGDAALASMASTLKMQAPPPTSRRAGTVRGRRDVRASVYGQSPVSTPDPNVDTEPAYPISSPTQPIQETTRSIIPPPPSQQPIQETTRAPLSISTSPMLSTQSPSSPVFNSATSSFSPFYGSAQAIAANVLARPASRIGEGDHDAGSIRSGRSLSSSTQSQTNKHPELHEPGLSTSIIETVSAWFEHGKLVRSVTIGEIALAHNPSSTTAGNNEVIRVGGFSGLEKVAPNPAFLTAAAQQGEYALNLSGLNKTTVAFKYQKLTSSLDASSSSSPLVITPAWKIEPTQTSAIITYSLNPAFSLAPGQSSVTLQNVTLLLHFEGGAGGKATSCLSKPVGNFDKSKGVIYWHLGAVTLTAAGSTVAGKLLARFQTPEGGLVAGTTTAGHVEAKWEIVPAPEAGVSGLGAGGGQVFVEVKGQEAEHAVVDADPFADESVVAANGQQGSSSSWKRVSEVRKLVAGVYHAR